MPNLKTEVAPAATHTPGEWKVGGGRAINAKAFDGSWKWIADKIRGGSPEEAEANARLIAAAPTLLEALKNTTQTLRLMNVVNTDGPSRAEVRKEIELAEAAISLAEEKK